IMELSSNSIMCFSNKYENYYILASHTWNEKTNSRESQGYSEKIATVSKLCLNNQHQTVAIETCCLNWFVEFYPFKYQVTSETICYCDNSMEAFYQGLSQNKKEYLDKIDLVAFFLAYGDGEFYDNFKDYDILQNIEIYIDEKYDFNHIIPNVRNYKKGIDEYCRIMDERKLKLYRDQILKLKLEINNFNLKEMQYGLSKQRIYNHL
ncbi:hypothetical protein HPX18_001880, partial [Campylobacter jejuni]|nr:hypothetical protein [Campylobacter jejuni]